MGKKENKIQSLISFCHFLELSKLNEFGDSTKKDTEVSDCYRKSTLKELVKLGCTVVFHIIRLQMGLLQPRWHFEGSFLLVFDVSASDYFP